MDNGQRDIDNILGFSTQLSELGQSFEAITLFPGAVMTLFNHDQQERAAMESNSDAPEPQSKNPSPPQPVCPACGGELFEIRAKLQCSRCHTICETCCEGGRG